MVAALRIVGQPLLELLFEAKSVFIPWQLVSIWVWFKSVQWHWSGPILIQIPYWLKSGFYDDYI